MLNKTDRVLAEASIKPLLDLNLELYRAAWHGNSNEAETLRKEYRVFCRETEVQISSVLEDFGLQDVKVSVAGMSPTYRMLGMPKVRYLTSLWA